MSRTGRTPRAPVLKVCGATTPSDLATLAAAGADHAGLWHGVPGGPAELTADELTALAAAAHATGVLRPVLVTFLGDAAELAALARGARIDHLQLHAYQPPSTLAALRRALPGAVLIKVLHLRDGRCQERPLIRAYERAGTDLFLLDTATDDGRIGSTGTPLAAPEALDVVARTTLPFWLAGGVRAGSRARLATVAAHPRFRGIDVDTGARDPHGRLHAPAVRALARTWGTARAPGTAPTGRSRG